MPAEEDYEQLNGMADRLGLEGKDRDKYITDHMGAFGYRPRTVWEDAEDEGDGEEEPQSRFSIPRKQTDQPKKRTQREVSTRRASGGNWQYGE